MVIVKLDNEYEEDHDHVGFKKTREQSEGGCGIWIETRLTFVSDAAALPSLAVIITCQNVTLILNQFVMVIFLKNVNISHLSK